MGRRAVDVDMGINEAWDNGFPLQVNGLRFRPNQGLDIGARPNADDFTISDRDGLDDRIIRVNCDNLSVE
jgi:hypothetical protein